jgi:hypothetical protein
VTTAVTGRDGSVVVEAPLGSLQVCIGRLVERVWSAVDLETVVEINV